LLCDSGLLSLLLKKGALCSEGNAEGAKRTNKMLHFPSLAQQRNRKQPGRKRDQDWINRRDTRPEQIRRIIPVCFPRVNKHKLTSGKMTVFLR